MSCVICQTQTCVYTCTSCTYNVCVSCIKDDMRLFPGQCRRCREDWCESVMSQFPHMSRVIRKKAIPVWLSNEKERFMVFDLLLPMAFHEETIRQIMSFLSRFRLALSQQTRIDAALSEFLDSQPYVCFNYILMPTPCEPRKATSPVTRFCIGDECTSLSIYDSDQEALYVMLMRQYV
jgi:hypothetical protein